MVTGGGDNAIVIYSTAKDEATGGSMLSVGCRFPESHDGDINCLR